MDPNEVLSLFSMNRLDGEPVPDDLRILLPHRDELTARTGVELELDERWNPLGDGGGAAAVGDVDAVADHRARAEVCRLCAFVARDGEGRSLGYWRGPTNREVAASPVVVLDEKGHFHLCIAQTFAEAVLERAYGRPEFQELKEWLDSLGIAVAWDSPTQLTLPHEKLPPKDLHRQLAERYRRALLSS
jgi:hypothetical protein